MADLLPLIRRTPGPLPPIVSPSPVDLSAGMGGLSPIIPLPVPQLPPVTLDPRKASLSSDPLITRKDALEADLYKRSNPIAPTSTLGKIGHFAANAGNFLGAIFPNIAENVKGSDLHNERIMQRDKADLEGVSKEQTANDQRKGIEATTAYTNARPAIEQSKILQKLTSTLAPKGIIATMNPDGTIDTEDDPSSQAYKNQVALAGMHQGTAQLDAIKSENADEKYKPGTPQYEEWHQRLVNAQKQIELHMAALGLSRERLGFQQDKFYNPQPTNTERNKGDMANSAADQIGDMKSIVLAHPEYFGPGFGQSQAFQKWIGSQDPDAQKFLSAQTIAADHLAATFGGRSDAALTALHNALGNFRDNPKAAQAALVQLTKANSVFQTAGKTHDRSGHLQPQQSATPAATAHDWVYVPGKGLVKP